MWSTDIVVFDYIHFPVFTHTTGMTHFQVTEYIGLDENKLNTAL